MSHVPPAVYNYVTCPSGLSQNDRSEYHYLKCTMSTNYSKNPAFITSSAKYGVYCIYGTPRVRVTEPV